MRRGFAAAAWLALLCGAALADETAAPDTASSPAPTTAPATATAVTPTSGPESMVMRPLWEWGIGVASLRLPDYRGSDQSSTLWLPLPYGVYRGKWLRADREGARAVLFDARSLEVDVSVAASPPTRSKDNAARAGMPDLKPALEFGPNANLTLVRSGDRKLKLDLRFPLRAAFSVQSSPRAIGVTFAPNLNLDLREVGGGWNIGLLAGPVFADRRYHDRIYGVAPEFATPQRNAYRAPGGYSGWQALGSVSRRFNSIWAGAFVRYDNLRGAAFVDSPLVRRDSALTLGIGVSWVLGTSSELVAAPE